MRKIKEYPHIVGNELGNKSRAIIANYSFEQLLDFLYYENFFRSMFSDHSFLRIAQCVRHRRKLSSRTKLFSKNSPKGDRSRSKYIKS